jgi:hypothetical protein
MPIKNLLNNYANLKNRYEHTLASSLAKSSLVNIMRRSGVLESVEVKNNHANRPSKIFMYFLDGSVLRVIVPLGENPYYHLLMTEHRWLPLIGNTGISDPYKRLIRDLSADVYLSLSHPL